jgi:hypothetical protein
MKKILCTTALVGTTILAGVNISAAQTTITGQLDLTYKSISSDGAGTAGTEKSYRGFGKETQINIANKGNLNVAGLSYAAGFSLELDGSESTTSLSQGAHSENIYIDIISGNTTLTISADHIQNPDFEITNAAGGKADIDDVAHGLGGLSTLAQAHKTDNANSSYMAYGFGIIQNIPNIARVSAIYVPSNTNANAVADGQNVIKSASGDSGNSQYDVMIDGSFGVKGARAFYAYSKAESETPGTPTAASDKKGQKYGVSYNFGQITLAASKSSVQNISNIDADTTSFAIAYAINKDATISLIRAKTDADATGALPTTRAATLDEKLTGVNIGYNLGPVTVNAWYVDGDNVGGASTGEGKAAMLLATTRF